MKATTQRELRSQRGSVQRAAAPVQKLTVTVGGRPVAPLGPAPRRQWVPKADYAPLLQRAARDLDFFTDLAELGEPIEPLDEPREPRRR